MNLDYRIPHVEVMLQTNLSVSIVEITNIMLSYHWNPRNCKQTGLVKFRLKNRTRASLRLLYKKHNNQINFQCYLYTKYLTVSEGKEWM